MTEIKRERRSGKRHPSRVPVSIKSQQGTVEATGFTRDLSAGGELEMVLILPSELTHGEKQWVCCRASVVRVEEGDAGGDFGVAASIESIEILPEIPT
jgi:PilZ domain